MTHALVPNSPAINKGSDALVASTQINDQRGAPFGRKNGVVDIGAFELGTLDPSFFIVTTLNDELDYSNTDVSLREAINSANGNVGTDTITFDPSLFTSGAAAIFLELGELPITESIVIDGPGQDLLTINANQLSRVMNVLGGTAIDVSLEGLTLTGGRTTGNNQLVNGIRETTHSGGGIRFDSTGTLTLNGSTVSGNSTSGTYARGGGIFTLSGAVTLIGSTVSGNSTTGRESSGGGIHSRYGNVNLTDSTISGNSTAGTASRGGGLYTRYGNAEITRSTISGNSTSGGNLSYGGGIHMDSGALIMNESTVSNNSTTGDGAFGGGIRTNDGTVTLSGTTVSDNFTTGRYASGGGIFTLRGAVTLADSVVSGNRTTGRDADGGGIYSIEGAVTMTNSTISGNSTTGDFAGGGGVYVRVSALTLTRSTVSGNRTSGRYSHGGGIYSNYNGATLTLIGSTISGNQVTGTDSDGGGVGFDDSVVTILNSTITGNSATRAGGGLGIFVDNSDKKLTIHNSIIAGNTAASNPDFTAPTDPANNLEVRFSLIGNNAGTSLTLPATGGNLIGAATAPIDPKLGPLATNGGTTQTHALLTGSPAINKGSDTLVDSTQINDQRGAPFGRKNGVVDMGAYELRTLDPSFFVVTTLNDELDYSNTAVSLREAIISANGNIGTDTITFSPSLFTSGAASIVLTRGELPVTESIVIDGPGQDLLTIDANQLSRVMNILGGTAIDVNLEGMTLTGGRTTGNNQIIGSTLETTHNGGGIRFDSIGTLTLTGSAVSGNRTTGTFARGGGIFSNSGAVTLTASTVSGNSTSGLRSEGGGIATSSGAVTLSGSTVSENSTSGHYARGGGIVTISGAVTLTSSTVSGNSTVGVGANGGGISTPSGAVTLIGSTVSGNSTSGLRSEGGGIFTISSAVTLTGSTVSENSTSGNYARGGGIFTISSAVTLTGSTVSENRTSGNYTRGGGIFTISGAVTLTGSTISGNQVTGTDSDGGGVGFNNSVVTIINSTITGNSATRAGGGLGIFVDNSDKKLTIHNSIIAGNTAASNPDFTAPTDPANNLEVRFSLIGNNAGTSLTLPATGGNLIGTATAPIDPKLGPLVSGGGPTQTHALLPGSPALDAADQTLLPTGVTTDQRRVTRVIDLLNVANPTGKTGLDIGAVEMVGLSIANATANESAATIDFVVTLSHAIPDGSSVSVDFSTANIAGQAIAGTDYTALNQRIVFVGGGALTATVAVPLLNDSLDESNETFAAALTNPTNAIITQADAVGTITDDDTRGITVSAISGNTTEAGGTATFTVVLTSQPTASVTIPLSSSDTTEGIVAPASLTFTTANWNVAQTVTVTGVNDDIDDGDTAFNIVTGAATGGDYAGLNANDVAVTNVDNDTLGITVSAISRNTTEAGGTATFTVVLASQPTANVTIPLLSSDTTEGTVAPASLTFTTANWNVAQTVTVTGVNDAIDDGDIAFSIVTAAATGGDYAGLNANDVAVTNVDDDTRGITVSAVSRSTTEAGGTATFTVVLASQPTASVTIPLSSSDITEGTVTPASLTFTTANWNVAQTVTVIGVNDTIDDGDIAFNIVTGAASGGDYAGINPSDVAVTNVDDDAAPIVTLSRNNATIAEAAGTSTITATLSNASSLPVTIVLGFTGTATLTNDFNRTATQLVIAPGQTTGTITVTSVQDTLDEVDETIIVDVTSVTNGTEAAAQQVTVTITDDDAHSDFIDWRCDCNRRHCRNGERHLHSHAVRRE
jgi:CSLREA domain-containing protein